MGGAIPGVPRTKAAHEGQADKAAEETLEVVRALFDRADENSSGAIDHGEMAPLVRLLYKEWDKPVPQDLNSTLPEVTSSACVPMLCVWKLA